MPKSRIIVAANQKGGVGKSTVSMLLANYLSMERKICIGGIIDTDPQKSVLEKRKGELNNIKATQFRPPYEIVGYDLSEPDKLKGLLASLRQTDKPYIFDTPGNLLSPGIPILLAEADFVLVPFNFAPLNLASTIRFLIYWKKLCHALSQAKPPGKPAKVIFIPTIKDERIGTKAEKELWAGVEEQLTMIGPVAPKIGYYSSIQKVGTLALTKEQLTVSEKTCELLFDLIFNPAHENE